MLQDGKALLATVYIKIVPEIILLNELCRKYCVKCSAHRMAGCELLNL